MTAAPTIFDLAAEQPATLIRRLEVVGELLDSTLKGPDYSLSEDKDKFDFMVDQAVGPVLDSAARAAEFLVARFDGGPTRVELKRVGLGGELFKQQKVRSMKWGTELLAVGLKDKNNDRIIPVVGKWIRKLSLDEAAQRDNILAREMSYVGPRPKAQEEFDLFRSLDPIYGPLWAEAYASMRPGETGYAQINGRGHLGSDTKGMMTIMLWDLLYNHDQSVATDTMISIKTVGKIASMHGAH